MPATLAGKASRAELVVQYRVAAPVKLRPDIDQNLLDDPDFHYEMVLEVEDGFGGWRFDESFVFVGGPNQGKNAGLTTATGFDLGREYIGRLVRLQLRRVSFSRDTGHKAISASPIVAGLKVL